MSCTRGGKKRNKPKGRRTAQWMSHFRKRLDGQICTSQGQWCPIGASRADGQVKLEWGNQVTTFQEHIARNEFARERKGSRGGIRAADAAHGAGMVNHHA